MHLLRHIEGQAQQWYSGRLTANECLSDWEILLGRLHEKADDLTIWRQLFFHTELNAAVSADPSI
jgi:hypothetical protein